MHTSLRLLVSLTLFLSAAAAHAQVDGHALYQHIAPQLAEHRGGLHVGCESGDARACEALTGLDQMLAAFEIADTACVEGDDYACRDLGLGVGILVVGAHCEISGNPDTCRQVEHIESLAPACGEGDPDACDEIEFALFGTEAPEAGSAKE